MAWNSPSKRIESIESMVNELASYTHGIRKKYGVKNANRHFSINEEVTYFLKVN